VDGLCKAAWHACDARQRRLHGGSLAPLHQSLPAATAPGHTAAVTAPPQLPQPQGSSTHNSRECVSASLVCPQRMSILVIRQATVRSAAASIPGSARMLWCHYSVHKAAPAPPDTTLQHPS
jgi:hypothetical protein